MAQTQEVICRCGCKQKFAARTADIRRGWGVYKDKSHKARAQEKRMRLFANKVMIRKLDICVLDADVDNYIGFGDSEDF